MHVSRTFRALMAALVWALAPAPGHANGARPQAVASFSILADLVKEIGGDRITVHSLVGADADTHVFSPSPRDASRIADADIVFINGLGFEGWIERLVAASGYAGPMVVASRGVPTIEVSGHGHHHGHGEAEDAHEDEHHGDDHAEVDGHGHSGEEDDEHARDGDPGHDAHDGHAHGAQDGHAHGAQDGHEDEHLHGGDSHGAGDADPHVWHSLARSRLYAANIATGLIGLDPQGAEVYAANLAALLASMAEIEREFQSAFAGLSPQHRILITSHGAFGYLADDFGLYASAPVGISTEAEASPADVVEIIRQIQERAVPAVFLDNITNPRLLQQITRETGVRIGGDLYSDALSGPGGPAPGYLQMMRHNLQTIFTALSGSG